MKRRYLNIGILLLGIIIVVFNFISSQKYTNTTASLTSFFQLLGVAPKAISRTFSQVISVTDLDEATFGEKIKKEIDDYNLRHKENMPWVDYLNGLLNIATWKKSKPFDYQIFVLSSDEKNAFAIPGGIIGITSALLQSLTSESEVVSILAHEVGHIELSHTFDAVKYQLLTQKINMIKFGELLDMLRHHFVETAFSKTEEDAADEYSFNFILNTNYNPNATASSLEKIVDDDQESINGKVNPIQDYLQSHPDTLTRINKFYSQANVWWKVHPSSKRYQGVVNFRIRISMNQSPFDNEWITSEEAIKEIASSDKL